MKNYVYVIGLAFFLSGCLSQPYRITKPEDRYPFSEDRDPRRDRKTMVKTFSLQPPQGNWQFWGVNQSGIGTFTGGPDGTPGRYVGYELSVQLETGNFRDKAAQLRALETGNFQNYVDESLEELKKFYAKLDLKGNDAGHPVPRKYGMKLVTFRGMTCTIYEDEEHLFIASQRPGAKIGEQGPGDGAEEYGIGFSCPGFHNGEQASFGYGARIRVSNRHVTDGVKIDPQALKSDLMQRVQRMLDSVEFEGEFTQRLPASFR